MSAIEFTRWRVYFPLVEEMAAEIRLNRAIEQRAKRSRGNLD